MRADAADSSSRRQKTLAAAAALLVLLGGLVLAPRATGLAPTISTFPPAFATALLIGGALAAFLFGVRHAASGLASDGLLGGAYLFTAVLATTELLLPPGPVAPALAMGADARTAAWLGVFRHAGFALLVIAAMLADRCRRAAPVANRHAKRLWPAVLGLPILAAIACIWAATRLPGILPALPGNDPVSWTDNPIMLGVCLLNLCAGVAVVAVTRLRNTVHLWLAVALLASVADAGLAMLSDARFSIGWYGARLYNLLALMAVLFALLREVSGLYHARLRAGRTG